MTISRARQIGGVVCVLYFASITACAYSQQSVGVDHSGRLTYAEDDLGNHIPDFSRCGYSGGDADIPDVSPKIVVTPADGDDGQRIQAALDYVGKLPIDEHGFRGAVRLAPGEFEVAGQLVIRDSGVVLQGSGATDKGTRLIATGPDRREAIRIFGEADRRKRGHPMQIMNEVVPVGSHKIQIESSNSFTVGDSTVVTRPSTAEWVKFVGGDAFGIGWRPGSRDIRWDRIVTAVDGNTVTLDAPVTTALERRWGGGTVQKYEWPGRITQVGVEDLQMISHVDSDNPRDEDHAWLGVTLDKVENAWVRRVKFRQLSGGAVHLLPGSKWVTVSDCVSTKPISEPGGYRRHTYFTQGQLGLFLRCWSEEGRRDFAVGHCAPGPNAFVNCHAERAYTDSGPLESWASGVLYDNVRIEGGGLHLVNRWTNPASCGWSAANCVLWQCRASTVYCFRPPGANNWSLGNWAAFSGDGTFEARSDFVRPMSLYQGQLEERAGRDAAKRIDPILGRPVSATNPTYEQAAEFVANSNTPARQLIDVIDEIIEAAAKERESRDVAEVKNSDDILSIGTPETDEAATHPLTLKNGWLVVDGRVKTGDYLRPTWWRGTVRPDDAPAMGPNISRFMPGRWGTGFTDELNEVADQMVRDDIAAYEHHYGLWYERRRDDHLMGPQEDGAVIPPFYEQPFARTGKGTAWDGLSRYDLTRPNPWYWIRSRDFARLCEQRGLVLFHQNYFQHNILEAGAHWVDCPWRPANNINDMGLPEPPPFIGDKRLFMAHHFYDLSYKPRRELHRQYIRQCLDALANSPNVVQLTSAEYTGPLEFVEFWLDTIIEWQREHQRDCLVALSATKDVQDAILADPLRRAAVDVVDIRYWTYDKNFKLYAPRGGVNLAPRQHMRQMQPEASSFASIVKAVRETRLAHPEKAVTYYADENCRSGRDGWAVLMGGGSLANVKLPAELAGAVASMQPGDGLVSADDGWCLAGGDSYLIYSSSGDQLSVTIPPGEYQARWLDPESGDVMATASQRGGKISPKPKSKALWLSRK